MAPVEAQQNAMRLFQRGGTPVVAKDELGDSILVETVRLFERFRVDRDHRVELVVVEGDALQILLDQATRAGSAVERRGGVPSARGLA